MAGFRSGVSDIYAQRIRVDGTVLWMTDGVAISTAPNGQGYPAEVVRTARGGHCYVARQRHGTTTGTSTPSEWTGMEC